jgi:hypothetical protein
VATTPPANWDERAHSREWTMEYLQFSDFNVDRRGRGAIVAEGDIEINGAERHLIYRFSTANGGISWSRPVTIAKLFQPAGIYRPAH